MNEGRGAERLADEWDDRKAAEIGEPKLDVDAGNVASLTR